MASPTELRVFISSTFRDLQEEREHLIKKIFPKIRSLCRDRGITFTEVDLRWGITEEEAEREGIIRICLDEIDRCRPYFIGILGQRYGWTPPREDAERVADDFPDIATAITEGASITEMELVHGVLANPAMADHAFFYFRDRAATPTEFVDTDAETITRLNELKQRIRQSGFPVRENYTSPAELGAWLEEDLRRVVEVEHPESETPSALELERRAHQAFAASRRRAYIANPEYAQSFTEWLAAPPLSDPLVRSLPLVITAASGLGKSSLIAHLVDEYRRDNPTAFIIEHYVGASRSSGTATAVMWHVVEEIRERFAITDEPPAKSEDLEKSFPNWLFRAEHFAKQFGIEMLIVIDAVNQLDRAGRRLTWLPRTIPARIRLLVSTTPGECAEQLTERAWAVLEVASIDDVHTREKIVYCYLGEFRKSITARQTRRLTTNVKASSPLYLRVVSEELRLHGEHETLDDVIDRYVSAVDLLDVFDRVLGRFEQDYGVATVERVMSVIWASRSGVSEVELMELAGVSRIDLSRLLFAIDYHFQQRDGLLGFFHDYLRRAVENRYLSDEGKQRSIHLRIAEYFQSGVMASIAGSGTAPLRMASELAYQLLAAGAMERLRECLSTMPVFFVLYDGETRYEVLGYWSAMHQEYDVEGSYRRGLEQWGMKDAGERSVGLGRVANMLYRLGRWTGAMELERERRTSAIERGDRSEEAASRLSLGRLMEMRGEHAEAFDEFEQGRDIYTELGDRSGISIANVNIGEVYRSRGEYDRAIESFECVLRISEELGDRSSLVIGNMGLVYDSRGEYDRALECFHRAAEEHRAIGFRHGLSYWLEGTGQVLVELDQAGGAMPEYLPKYLSDVAEERWRVMAVQQARMCAEECIAISDELSKPDTQLGGRILLGRVEAAEGHLDVAIETFETMLAEATDDDQRAELHYWLWRIGGRTQDSGHREENRGEAMRLYGALFEKSAKSDYRKRIEELGKEGR